MKNRKLRMGMIGGGSDAFIGAIHRRAALMENQIELVCGCFSINPEISLSSGRSYYLPDNRIYTTWQEMIQAEASLPQEERMDFVTIVTPNRFHYEPAMAALDAGFDVVIDKPSTLTFEEALSLREKVYQTGRTLALTHVYSAYPAIKDFCDERGIECLLSSSDVGGEGLIKLCELTEARIGTMLSEIPFSNIPIIFKNCGLDFLIVDTEHGAFDYSALSPLITTARLINLPILVRLSDNSRRDITRLADMGADGFILPMTNTKEDIGTLVEYAKYAPIGNRGISTNRAHTFYDPPPMKEYMSSANERIKVYAQIESASGVENIDQILSLNGVDGAFVGPNDLSISLGCVGNDAPIISAISRVAESAKLHQKPWGIITTSQNLISHSLNCDASFISYGSEINMIKDSCKLIRRKIYV